MGLHSCSLRTQADCPPRKAGQDQTAAHSHSYTGETPDASEAMSTRTQVLHVHFGLLYMWTVLQSAKTELLENFLRGENIQNMLYGLYLERHERMLIQQKRATLLILQTGVFRRIIINQLRQKTPLLKNTRACVDWAGINAEFSWCAGVEQIIFTPQDCNSSNFFHAQIVALCPLVDVCVQHVAFLSAWSAGFAVGRWLLPAQTALLTATGQQRGQKTQPRTKKHHSHIYQSVL